jgi:hypothetical protein
MIGSLQFGFAPPRQLSFDFQLERRGVPLSTRADEAVALSHMIHRKPPKLAELYLRIAGKRKAIGIVANLACSAE